MHDGEERSQCVRHPEGSQLCLVFPSCNITGPRREQLSEKVATSCLCSQPAFRRSVWPADLKCSGKNPLCSLAERWAPVWRGQIFAGPTGQETNCKLHLQTVECHQFIHQLWMSTPSMKAPDQNSSPQAHRWRRLSCRSTSCFLNGRNDCKGME